MKIIILGAGQVGSTAAHHLAKEESNDLTVVDRDANLLRNLQSRLDIRTVLGQASHPDTLRKAGIEDAEMVIAVTDSDETNMVACQVAWTLHQTPIKIARVRAVEYLTVADEMFTTDPSSDKSRNALPVDFVISPEQLVTDHIKRLIQYPGALQVLDFAGGRARLVGVRVSADGLLCGQQLRTLREHIPHVDSRVAAIYRGGAGIVPEGDTVIEEHDEVFFIAARRDIRVVMSELRRLESTVRRITIAGGGNIGLRLAQELEGTNNVKLIERDRDRARQISEILQKTVVLNADAADQDLLQEESIEATDVFCAVTNAEEANILSAMLAKRLGARKVLALISRRSYGQLVEQSSIDVAISPQQITISALLAYVRRGDVVAVHSLRGGAAEAIEGIAHGDRDNSKVVGRSIEEVPLPEGVTIGAIVRGEGVLMAHHDLVVESNDHLIMFVTDRSQIPEVEKLFEVGVTFT
jgi:trk/ktr system potassium uptake protein